MKIGLVGFLRAAWLAGTLPILVSSIPCFFLEPLRETLLFFAGRGKILQSSSRKFTVPKKLFTHFYVVATVCTSTLLFATWIYAWKIDSLLSESLFHSNWASYMTGGSHIFNIHKTLLSSADQRFRAWRSVFLLLLMEVQALRRLYESIYVFDDSSTARMHILGYLTGIFFYIAAPLSLCCDTAPYALAFIANRVDEFIMKGKDRVTVLDFSWRECLIPLIKSSRWTEWIGAMIFLWGSVHQYRCHLILGKLRKGNEQTNDYAIPRGDWFEVVSSPHYLAEIVIYGGLVVASGGMDFTIWLLFGFVVANLSLGAAETHRWYHRKFEIYPQNRYAIVPYIY